MKDEPVSNFQCPSCGNMSVVNRIKYKKSEWFRVLFDDKKYHIDSKSLVCLKCKWEHDTWS